MDVVLVSAKTPCGLDEREKSARDSRLWSDGRGTLRLDDPLVCRRWSVVARLHGDVECRQLSLDETRKVTDLLGEQSRQLDIRLRLPLNVGRHERETDSLGNRRRSNVVLHWKFLRRSLL